MEPPPARSLPGGGYPARRTSQPHGDVLGLPRDTQEKDRAGQDHGVPAPTCTHGHDRSLGAAVRPPHHRPAIRGKIATARELTDLMRSAAPSHETSNKHAPSNITIHLQPMAERTSRNLGHRELWRLGARRCPVWDASDRRYRSRHATMARQPSRPCCTRLERPFALGIGVERHSRLAGESAGLSVRVATAA